MGCRAAVAAEAFAIERTTQVMIECYQQLVNDTSERKWGLRTRLFRWIDGL